VILSLPLAKIVVAGPGRGIVPGRPGRSRRASVPLGYLADFIYFLSLDAIRRAWLRRPMLQSRG
jgi:hypothetical protein